MLSDAFQNHLLAVLSLNDAGGPGAQAASARAQLLEYDGPRDAQTDAILQKLDGLLANQKDSQVVSTPLPESTKMESLSEELRSLKDQARCIGLTTQALKARVTSKRIEAPATVELLDMNVDMNQTVDPLSRLASEITRVGREVGMGKLGGRVQIDEGVQGVWRDVAESVNALSLQLTMFVRASSLILQGALKGERESFITIEAYGEIDEFKTIVNQVVFDLSDLKSAQMKKVGLASEVARL